MNNALSLFHGMGCFNLACQRSGLSFDNIYTSEIDKYASIVDKANNPDNVSLGDVEGWRHWNIDWSSINLIVAGSPCQGFSIAGKQLAFDDPRSKLFFVFADILEHIKALNPNVKFLLENVRMKQQHQDIINAMVGVKPIVINSSLVSAQNRVRYYWCNWEIGQPEDKGVLLGDILGDGIVDRDKSYCIDACYYKGGNPEQYFNKHRRQLVFTKNYLQFDVSGKGHKSQDQRAYYLEGKHGTVPARGGESKLKVLLSKDPIEYRKLTPIECERLQTVPDNYTNHVSNSQRYKMLGNGWTVDVIAHILSYL